MIRGVVKFLFLLTIQLIIATDPCRFETSKGVIDLTSIGRNDGTAAYQDQLPVSVTGYRYSYNPCRPFSEGTSCQNVAACQVSLDGLYTYSLGTHDSVTWNDGSAFSIDPTVSYQYNMKIVRVILECAGSGPEYFEVLGETGLNIYTFRLRHHCACWDGCKYITSTTTTTTTTTQLMNTTITTTTITSSSTYSSPTKITSATIRTTTSIASNRIIFSKGMIFMIILHLVYFNQFFTY